MAEDRTQADVRDAIWIVEQELANMSAMLSSITELSEELEDVCAANGGYNKLMAIEACLRDARGSLDRATASVESVKEESHG